ncbi:thermonuclease family protein [Niallia sp. XMNu-256]|uniref:thermonuclease family protein n=1 Tax=Niallia sp. XMNu-256 TaxID=3082444 RepID=UPI0030D5E9D3
MNEYSYKPDQVKSILVKEKSNDNDLELVKVIKVIDGDTIVVSDGRSVRLIGVNTPECSFYKIEPYGIQAKKYTTYKLLGKSVWLQRDVSEVDRYHRSLRIVWLEKPVKRMDIDEIREKMFNAQLVLDGVAEAVSYYPDVTYGHCLGWLMGEAKGRGMGMWG